MTVAPRLKRLAQKEVESRSIELGIPRRMRFRAA